MFPYKWFFRFKKKFLHFLETEIKLSLEKNFLSPRNTRIFEKNKISNINTLEKYFNMETFANIKKYHT